jgi:hypothetical protein
MAKPVIIKRQVKAAALTFTELDTNFQNLRDATVTLTAGTGGTNVVSDLNGTITLVAGTGITLTGDNTAKTITINVGGFYANGNKVGNFKPDATLGSVQTVTFTGSASVNDFAGTATAGNQVKLICTVGSVITPMTFTSTMLFPLNDQNNYFQTNPTKSWTFDAGDKFVLDIVYDGSAYWCEINTIYQ